MPALRSAVSKVDYPAILAEAWQQHLAPRATDAPTVISTFAGCGGSSLGYSMAGFKELLAVEWDDNAVATFKLNFPDVPVYHGDIAKLSAEQVLQQTGLQPGQLDVFDGSPPCQGFSTTGKRDFGDDRNQLFREYVRLLRGLKPKVFVMENVSGMVKGKMKLIFAEILRELKASGYKVSARLLNAMYFNVPQSRERMIFVGVREDLGIEPSHPKAESKPVVVRDAWANLNQDEDQRKFLLECGKKYAGYKEWDSLKPGQSARFGDNYKISPDLPMHTIVKTTGSVSMRSVMHHSEKRRPTVPELKRGGSFPDDYMFQAQYETEAQRIGNSVPPLFMRSIASHIRREILNNIDTGNLQGNG